MNAAAQSAIESVDRNAPGIRSNGTDSEPPTSPCTSKIQIEPVDREMASRRFGIHVRRDVDIPAKSSQPRPHVSFDQNDGYQMAVNTGNRIRLVIRAAIRSAIQPVPLHP